VVEALRELSLFSGAGGGLLGTKLLGWKHLGYVEYNDYCQKVIAQRIKDGILDEAPIFGDIRSFLDQGYARSYQGMVDVVTAGFPCQPFSVSGKGRAEEDERNMWPFTIDTIRKVRPQFCLLENVSGLLAHEYYGEILRDLAAVGYSAQWDCFSSSSIDANHERERLFIVAYAYESRLQGKLQNIRGSRAVFGSSNKMAENHYGESLQEDGRIWPSESTIRRVVNEVDNWVDRLKAIGNGQDPIVVKTAWGLMGPQ
jgi:DNA (cytosine-5)-methyltransferase 1